MDPVIQGITDIAIVLMIFGCAGLILLLAMNFGVGAVYNTNKTQPVRHPWVWRSAKIETIRLNKHLEVRNMSDGAGDLT